MAHRKVSLNASKQTPGRSRARDSGASFAARARRNVAAKISFPHPLSWWRTRPAHEFKKKDIVIARHFLTRSAIIGEPHWFLGAAGNAAVAIGVALRARRRGGNTLVSLDVAMSAVLCCALEGHPEAALLISATLERRREVDPPCRVLSDSWLTYASKGAAPSRVARGTSAPKLTLGSTADPESAP
jgi:hypothetical protein